MILRMLAVRLMPCIVLAGLAVPLVPAHSLMPSMVHHTTPSDPYATPFSGNRALQESGIQSHDGMIEDFDVFDGAMSGLSLQQAAEQVNVSVSVVETAQQLLNAIGAGAQHIEVRAHLDFTTVQPRDNSDSKRMLGEFGIEQESYSIRGNCSSIYSDINFDVSGINTFSEWQTGQCIIVTDVELLLATQNVWLHNLYIRHTRKNRTDTGVGIRCFNSLCKLWLTGVTLKGDGEEDPDLGGLVINGGQLYAQGVSVSDFGSTRSALLVSNGATATLNNCSISNNFISGTYINSAALSVNAVDPNDANAQQQNTIVRLLQTTFSGNTAAHNLIAYSGQDTFFSLYEVGIFSDDLNQEVFYTNNFTKGTALPLDQAPADRPGIDASTPWFVSMQEVFGPIDPPPNSLSPSGALDGDFSTPLTPEDLAESSNTTSEGSGGVSSAVAIVVGVSAVVLLCMAAMCAAIICMRHRRSHKEGKTLHEKNAAMYAENGPQSVNGPPTLHPRQDVVSSTCAVESETAPASDTVASSTSTKMVHPPESTNYTARETKHDDLTMTSGSQVNTLSSIHTASATTTTSANQAMLPPLPQPGDGAGSAPPSPALRVPPESTFVSTVPALSRPLELAQNFVTHSDGIYGSSNQASTVPVRSLLPPPGPNASADERVDFLHQQLDSFGVDKPIVWDLMSLGGGGSERRQGGQAVVQMAVRKGTMLQYAIKFFLSTSAFQDESGLFRQGRNTKGAHLAQFLPKVLQVHPNQDGRLKDAHGHALPPCIVMERGESLDLWAARRHPDRTMAFAMIHQLASRVKDLHALGYVHRDLKPGNVMWLPRENRWTIIDFGCVANTGESARLGFTMAYAAPEVISAFRRRDQTMVAQEAVDAWSLGVMAFELLTGRPSISMMEGKEKAMDHIEGLNGLHLPWEGAIQPTVRRQLGVFKDSLLQLLARNPDARPSMEEFCLSCDRVLAGSTTVQV